MSINETQSLLEWTTKPEPSSSGQAHDLFVSLEAMSPREHGAGGTDLHIRYGVHTTLFGHCLISLTHRGICNIHFMDKATALQQLYADWPQAKITRDQTSTGQICDQIFHASHPSPLTLHLKGTPFQILVWQALLSIPLGELTTYQGLATSLGKPTAARAVGNAVGRNPIAYLIPCHRVIRRSGEMGGYRWGCQRKAAILDWEASQKRERNLQNPDDLETSDLETTVSF